MRAFVFLLSTVFLSLGTAFADELRFVTISNSEEVGQLIVQRDGNTLNIDYRVDNNGRGPKLTEQIVFNENAIPISWRVNGQSLMGAEVTEEFEIDGRTARWTSQADEGEERVSAPRLYVANDTSPYALAIYERVARRSGESRISILPRGEISVTSLGQRVVTADNQEKTLELVRIGGISLSPSTIALDEAGELFAVLGGGSIIRDGAEAFAEPLGALSQELAQERAYNLQETLAHQYDVPVQIINVRILDPQAGTLSKPSAVTVYRGKITRVFEGKSAPATADTVIIDGEGGTLMPGLHDMHAHMNRGSGLYYLAAGVTTVRDMGNDNDFLQDYLVELDRGVVSGPRVVPSGFLEGRSPFSMRLGSLADSFDEAKETVDWYAQHGYFQVKIYNSFPPDWIAPIAAYAQSQGLGVTGHVPAFSTPNDVIKAGYDDIAHINQLMLGWLLEQGEDTRTPLRLTAMARAVALDLNAENVQETVGLMRQNEVALDPTAVILERLMLSRARTVQPGDRAYLDHMPIGYQRNRRRTFAPIGSEAEDKAYQDSFNVILDVLALLHENEIQLLPGTDDGTGFTLLRELELYAQAGIPPADVLRLATIDAATYLGRGESGGVIERGRDADFVLLEKNPLKDIAGIRTARMVVRGGVIYYPEEIYQALDIRPFTTKPRVLEGAAE